MDKYKKDYSFETQDSDILTNIMNIAHQSFLNFDGKQFLEVEKIDASQPTDLIVGKYFNLSLALEKKLEKVTGEERIKDNFLNDIEKVERFSFKRHNFVWELCFGFCILFSF